MVYSQDELAKQVLQVIKDEFGDDATPDASLPDTCYYLSRDFMTTNELRDFCNTLISDYDFEWEDCYSDVDDMDDDPELHMAYLIYEKGNQSIHLSISPIGEINFS